MIRFLKIFTLSLFIISCGGGGGDGDSGGGDPPPAPTPPGNPTLTSPANNTVCETGSSISDTQSNVTFTWQSSSSTNSYDLEVKNLNTNSIQNVSGITTTTTTVTLEKGEPYSWKVISKNNQTTQTGTSSTWKFYLDGALNTTRTETMAVGSSWMLGNYSRINGNGNTNNHYFRGRFDEIAVWDRTLTATEITKVYDTQYAGTGLL